MSCGCGNKEPLIPTIMRKIRKIREIANDSKKLVKKEIKILRINKK